MMVASQAADLLGVTSTYIKKLLKENEIEYTRERESDDGRVKIPPESIRKLMQMRGICYKRRVVTIGIEKGGVGKSLLTVNVAAMLAQRGAKVLLIDLDPEACATSFFYPTQNIASLPTIYEILKGEVEISKAIIKANYSVDLLPCKGTSRRVDRITHDKNPKKLLTDQIKNLDYDVILFDVPPNFTRLVSSAYLASDLVILPTFPDAWSIESIALTIEDIEHECKDFDCKIPDIKILMNKYNMTRVATKEAWEVLVNTYPQNILSFHIRESAALQNIINNGQTVINNGITKDIRSQFADLCNFICPPVTVEQKPEEHLSHVSIH